LYQLSTSPAGAAVTATASIPVANEWWLGSTSPPRPATKPLVTVTDFGACVRRSVCMNRRHQEIGSSANGFDIA
jgi:hypothetical protein